MIHLKAISFSFLMLCSVVMASGPQHTMTYQGQREESIELDNFLNGTRTHSREVPSTCTRKIPYTENVCGYETNYRQECHEVPGRQVCRTEHEQTCRYETRYRQECSGGQRQCRTIPGDVVCQRMPNGENRCTKVPPREVCDGGSPVCRNVPYQERVCSSSPRPVCHWEQPRQECRSVPYRSYECRLETRYKDETYACTRTVEEQRSYRIATYNADVAVTFNDQAKKSPIDFVFALDKSGDISATGKDNSSSVAAFAKKEISVTQSTDAEEVTNYQINAKYPIILLDFTEIFKITRGSISNVKLQKTALQFDVAGIFEPTKSSLKLKISRSVDDVKLDKALSSKDFVVTNANGISTIAIDLGKLGAPRLSSGIFTRKHKIEVELAFDNSDLGESIFPDPSAFVLKTQASANVD